MFKLVRFHICYVVLLSLTILSARLLAQDDLFGTFIEIPFVDVRPHGVDMADVDEDGDLDILYAARPFNYSNDGNESSATFGVILNNGDGTFTFGASYLTGGQVPRQFGLGDFNCDGKLDAAIPHDISGTLVIFMGNGDGTFVLTQKITHDGSRYSQSDVETGDFNNDGYDDIALSTNTRHLLSIFKGTPGGVIFEKSINVGDLFPGLAVADFDNDGNLDVAVARHYKENMSVYFGDGNLNFIESQAYPVGIRPAFLTAADFNTDGFPDIAVTNRDSHTVSVIASNGDGTFYNLTTLPVGSFPIDITAGDFNYDGSCDLAITHAWAGDVLGIVLGNGAGQFSGMIEIWEDSELGRVACADLNNNGTDDVVVNFFFDPKIKVYFTIPPCSFGPENQPLSFTRDSGAPTTETVSWESCGGAGTLVISSGENKSEIVSSCVIYLNGELVVGPEDFSKKVKQLSIPVTLFEGTNYLDVELRSKPGSKIVVEFVSN